MFGSFELARRGLGEPVNAQEAPYKRWYDRFVAIFAGIALLAIFLALFDTEVALANRLGAIAVTLGLMGWFAWRGRWHQLTSDARLLVFLIGMLVAVILAIRLWAGAGLLLFSVYWLGFAYCRTLPALIYAAFITIGSQWAFGAFDNVAWSDLSFTASVLLGLALALVISGMMAGYIEMFVKESDRRADLIEELRTAQAELAEQEREAGIRQERERLSAEIHDTIAQHFTSIVTNLTAAETRVNHNPEAAHEHVDAALMAARQGITDSRRMVRALHPDVLTGRTISQALREVSSKGTAGLAVKVREAGTPRTLDRLHEAILVRALQEALVNIRKHANAANVDITITWEEDDMILDIADDGRGFDPGSVNPGVDGFRMGLRTMQNRVEGAGGTWMLETAPNEGTSLAISFPVSAANGDGQ